MGNILVNPPSGGQALIEISEGGAYFDTSRVLWDERIDGVMPPITLGGMVRLGSVLSVDSALLAANSSVELAAKKSLMWRKIHDKREQLKFAGGFYAAPHWFHSDMASRVTYSLMLNSVFVNALPDTYTLEPEWKTMSGAFTPMTVALLKKILLAGTVAEKEYHNVAKAHKTAMEALADPSKYNYLAGWPVSFA